MADTLDSFLIARLDECARFKKALWEIEERFWTALGASCGAIVDDALGTDYTHTFGDDYWATNYQGYALHRTWSLVPTPDAGKPEETHPALWFPNDGADLYSLCGLAESPTDVSIWAKPLSAQVGSINKVRPLWEEMIAGPLADRGWVRYGERATSPNAAWGLKHPVVLDQHELADGLRSNDLRPALGQLERLVQDFASICPAMTELLGRLR